MINLADPAAETADDVAGRIRKALGFIEAARPIPGPDCGMKYLSREIAFAKLRALADGASQVRQTLGTLSTAQLRGRSLWLAVPALRSVVNKSVAVTEEASSRSESIYLDLRRKLISGYYQPNHRLKLSDLCGENGVSVSVVREALTRLAEQGLIQSQPNKGFFVPIYTPEEINDLAFMRTQVESLAVRLSVERGNAGWEASVVAAHHELRLTPRVPAGVNVVTSEQWKRAHGAFHAACGAACGSPRLIRLRQRLYDEAEAMRQMAGLSGGRSRDVEGEHAALAKAIVARNADRAAELTVKHIEITADQSVKSALARAQGER